MVHFDVQVHTLNDVSMFLGLLSCLGLMMVACFQWTEVLMPHIVGAMMVFVLGSIYCWFQSYLSYICIGITTSKCLTALRTVLSFLAVAGLATTIVCGHLAQAQLKAAGLNNGTAHKLHWNSTEPGYKEHLGSTFSEWIMCFAFLFFFATYYTEFKTLDTNVHVSCKVPEQQSIVTANQQAVHA